MLAGSLTGREAALQKGSSGILLVKWKMSQQYTLCGNESQPHSVLLQVVCSQQIKRRDYFCLVTTREATSRLLCAVLESSSQEDIDKLERVQTSCTDMFRELECMMDSKKLREQCLFSRREARLCMLLSFLSSPA